MMKVTMFLYKEYGRPVNNNDSKNTALESIKDDIFGKDTDKDKKSKIEQPNLMDQIMLGLSPIPDVKESASKGSTLPTLKLHGL
jgi:hypothetical protein